MKPKDMTEQARSIEQLAEFGKPVRDQKDRIRHRVRCLIDKAISNRKFKVICIKAPIGSGKTRGIASAVVENRNIAFTIFVKTRELAKEYGDLIHKLVSEWNQGHPDSQKREVTAYIFEGRNKDNCIEYDEIESAWKRGLLKVVHICHSCQNNAECPLRHWQRFSELSNNRVVIATYPMFELIAKEHRKWNGEERIFVVDENYFESLTLARPFDFKEISTFWNVLGDFVRKERRQIWPEYRELHKKILNADYNERYLVTDPIEGDFEIDEQIKTSWDEYFGDEEKNTNAYNLWYHFLSGIRHGAIITRHHKAQRHSSVTFYPELRKLVSLRNKLIILDATYRHKTNYLEKLLDLNRSDIRPPKGKPIRSQALSVYHYPFCNVSNHAVRDNLPRVQKWIDWVLENRHCGSTNKYCVICYKSYEEELKRYLQSKWEGKRFSFEYFHFGDETGSNKGEYATNVMVIGKFQLPPYVIQAMFLGKKDRDQLGWNPHPNEGIKFEDNDLQDEYEYHSFRAAYQGVGRSRFLGHYVVAHILSKGGGIDSKWKEIILTDNYHTASGDEQRIFKSVGRPPKKSEIVDAIFDILEHVPHCCPKDIEDRLNIDENTVKKYRDEILGEYRDRLELTVIKPSTGRPSKCFALKEQPDEVSP